MAIQVVETLTENLRLPAWFPAPALGLLVIGLPIMVATRSCRREWDGELIADTERKGGSLKEIALVYGSLGEVDRAFEYLDRAYEVDPAEFGQFASDPTADPLRDDPRFEAPLERLGLQSITPRDRTRRWLDLHEGPGGAETDQSPCWTEEPRVRSAARRTTARKRGT